MSYSLKQFCTISNNDKNKDKSLFYKDKSLFYKTKTFNSSFNSSDISATGLYIMSIW